MIHDLRAELDGAIQSKKAPEFQVLSYSLINKGTNDGMQFIKVNLHLLLDGEKVKVTTSQKRKIQDEEKVFQVVGGKDEEGDESCKVFNGRLGSFDLVERALQKAVKKRWTSLAGIIDEKMVESYAVHAMGGEGSHNVQILIKVPNGRGNFFSVRVVGVDTVAKTVSALAMVYHWVVWRKLRRQRGEEKNGN